MLGIAVVVLVDCAAPQVHPSQQAGVDQLVECAIHRGTADLAPLGLLGQVEDQLLGVEVVVPLKDEIDKNPPLLGDSLALALEKL